MKKEIDGISKILETSEINKNSLKIDVNRSLKIVNFAS
jgi:hypothetical protein